MTRRKRRRFGDCGSKARYGSRDEAMAAHGAYVPYFCERCGCWHLTSWLPPNWRPS